MRPVWSHPGTAQEPRRRPQEASRGAHTRLGMIPKRFVNDSGTPGTLKNLKKGCTVSVFRYFCDLARKPSTEARKAPNGAPREAQMSPRRAPGGPRSSQEQPRSLQEPPGARQEAPKTTQERSRRGPKGPQAAQTPPEMPSGAHFGLILAPPGGPFSSPPGVLFELRARSTTHTKALFGITGQKVFRERCGPDVQRPLSTKLLN